MIEPKNNEWWLCERGGVKTVFLRKDDEWRGDEKDTYNYCNVTPLFKMIEDKPSSCESVSPKHTCTEYEKVTYSSAWKAAKDHEERKVELWRKSDLNEAIKGNNWKAIQSPSEAAQYHFDLYHKVEKEIDWREDADSYFLKTKRLGIDCTIEEAITRSDYCDEFIELCRVALRANGELD